MRRHTLRGVASKFECQAGTTPRCLLTCSGRQYNSMSRNGLQSSASERDNPGEVRPLLESKEMHEMHQVYLGFCCSFCSGFRGRKRDRPTKPASSSLLDYQGTYPLPCRSLTVGLAMTR